MLHVYGNNEAKLFTADGIKRAESAMSNTMFSHGLTVTVDLYDKTPEGKTVPTDEAGKEKFFHEWAIERTRSDKAKGIYVLVCRHPGFVEVIADETTRERGFTNENEKQLKTKLTTVFRAANEAKQAGKTDAEQLQIRDEGLKSAVDFIISDLSKDTTGHNRNDDRDWHARRTRTRPGTRRRSASGPRPAGMSSWGSACCSSFG